MTTGAARPPELWATMRHLIERMVTTADRDEFLDDSLDVVVELCGADRGLILLSDDTGATCAINARGRGRALTAAEREEISRTIVREVQRTGRAVVWEPDLRSPMPASAASLGIAAAIAAPLPPVALSAGARGERGVVYLDFRDASRPVGDAQRELLEVAANLMSMVVERSQTLALVREDLRAALAQVDGPAAPSLASILAPRSMDAVRRELELTAQSDLPILMLGESGTGKTLLARAVAHASGRTPVVRATLGQADDLNTITSELFGHERGSFSGALGKRVGLVEFADGGTLILDEILNLPAHAQQLLLDFTQFGTFRPLGWPSAEPKTSRVRLVAATNGDLPAAIAAQRFREDLFYRLSSVTITLPPLRARREDIPSLADGLLRRLDPARTWSFTVEARRMLVAEEWAWPGNLRQLEAAIQRARLRALAGDPRATTIDAPQLDARDLGSPAAAAGATAPARDVGDGFRKLTAQRQELDDRERELIQLALARHGGVVARAAQELGIPRTSLVSRVQTLKIKT